MVQWWVYSPSGFNMLTMQLFVCYINPSIRLAKASFDAIVIIPNIRGLDVFITIFLYLNFVCSWSPYRQGWNLVMIIIPLQHSWKGVILVSHCLSICLSVPQSICRQNRVHSVSSTMLAGSISYLQPEFLALFLNLWLWLHLVLNWDLLWINRMGNHGVAGVFWERRHSSCSSLQKGWNETTAHTCWLKMLLYEMYANVLHLEFYILHAETRLFCILCHCVVLRHKGISLNNNNSKYALKPICYSTSVHIRSQPMIDHAAYVTSSLLGQDLAQPKEQNGPGKIDISSVYLLSLSMLDEKR